ncbi:EAL domain-containing protein (putative c-di-GMP-specific phosphodiesterase class I) [Sporosarcina luteola]|nr:EAL domain-containing protein (putative c-di-GMP-specific phosphodiesterase class I) [Sporosarcina luteola]
MFCDICMPKPLEFELSFESAQNIAHLPAIHRYLEEIGMLVRSVPDGLTAKEEAMKGLLDYIEGHMDPSDIRFRTDQLEWKPIAEAAELIGTQWIDQIIDEGHVGFHIQPIVDANQSLYAYEMLARFTDGRDNPISPFEVFQTAKLRNRMYALDRICRINAVKQAAALTTKVFINFIPTSIYSPEHCLRTTVQLASELNIEPSRFVFEVVETEEVKDPAHLKRILEYYRSKGFRYALDDVGAGYNTIETIHEMKPYYTKLDMHYVRDIHKDNKKQQIARTVLEATISVGATPLAEGIEDEAEFIWLKNAGFQLFQGYLFGKPAPIEK